MAEAIDQNREIKQRAIRRLMVAVVLVFAAIGILTYLSYYKPPKVAPKPAAEALPPPPPPIVTGPEPQQVQPATSGEVPAPAPESTQPPAPAIAPAPALTLAPPPPPPPAVVSKPLAKPGPGPKKDSEPTKTLVKAQTPPATPPQAAAPAPAAPAAPASSAATPAKTALAPTGYLVQFGVFSSMQNAAQLVERLKQLGIDAQTETRVHLPAFKTKAEADAALAVMKEKGVSAVVVGK